MSGSETDREWERWGRQDPYFGVITIDKYRNRNLDEAARAEFFRTGFEHAAHVLEVCRRHFDPAFAPARALDFGCGVGRLVVPLAGACGEVVGVDVSEAMLAEARRNCEARGLVNVTLVPSDDALSRVTGRFDLVHSFIVLQHIEAARGVRILERLVGLLADGGIGALHVKYGDRGSLAHELRTGAGARLRRHAAWVRRQLGRLGAALRRRLARPADPAMQMNAYPLDRVLYLLQRAGAGSCRIEFTDHGGELGAFVFFARARSPAPHPGD